MKILKVFRACGGGRWAYFALKTGWLKINIETNMGPQVYMYLSALESHSHLAVPVQVPYKEFLIKKCRGPG